MEGLKKEDDDLERREKDQHISKPPLESELHCNVCKDYVFGFFYLNITLFITENREIPITKFSMILIFILKYKIIL